MDNQLVAFSPKVLNRELYLIGFRLDPSAEGAQFYTLIGEELFAVPAYLQAGPFHVASLQVQDILRWVVIALILGGVVLKLVGVSLL